MDDASDIAAIVKDFLVETGEHLDRLDRDVMALEANADDAERLASVFRSFHTIKGTCAWLGFAQLEALAHSAESLLSSLRDGNVRMNTDIASLLLAVGDAIRHTLPTIEATQSEGEVDFTGLRQRLDAHNPDHEPATVRRGFANVAEALQELHDPQVTPSAERTVRVDVHLLDRLLNTVGELVLARNQIVQGLEQPGSALAPAATQRLKAITSELQEGVMKARLQPIGSVWNMLPRLVRETAKSVEKVVQLEMMGQETEVDRSLLQTIKDPLTHLVRNAVDHGIETPEVRRAAGKTEYGFVRLAAYHEGGQVVVEVSDDGAGLDLARIKGVAVARNIIDTQDAVTMSDRDLAQLAFRPGFSTRQAVTSVSGRGVGLDVVKTQVERIGGTIDLDSKRGEGMTVRLRVPLTLAIIQALIVRCGGGRYALPQVSIVELTRVQAEQVGKLIDKVYASPVLRLRGSLVPLVDLAQVLGLPPTPLPVAAPDSDEAVNIVILEAARQRFGLIVDSIGDTEEIVVKPLSRHLDGIPVYSGATVMSDGKVGVILDAQGIARAAHVLEHEVANPETRLASARAAKTVTRRYLLAAFRDGGQLAIPLEHVDRLEELRNSQVERLGVRDVVQYRGSVLPLLRSSEIFEERRQKSRDPGLGGGRDDTLFTIVYNDEVTRVGIIVERILDVIDDVSGVDIGPAPRRGSSGTIIVGGRVAEIIDARAVARAAGRAEGVQ
ncbi:MAG: chemotaxis protein CheA [Myxococcota bacterium]